jgi:hypothetical protein
VKTTEELCTWALSRADDLQAGMSFRTGSQGGSWWWLDDQQKKGELQAKAASALDFLRTYAGESSEWFTRAQQFYANNGDRQSFESGVRSVGDVLRLWVSDVRAGVAPIRLGAVEGARVVATTDVMSQVRSLLADKSVHPAAPIVLAGGALETALKGIVLESELEVRGNGSILAYAKALRENNLVSKQEMKDIEQMAGLRNDAAHGNFEELSRERAGLMEQQVNLLLSRLAERFDGS